VLPNVLDKKSFSSRFGVTAELEMGADSMPRKGQTAGEKTNFYSQFTQLVDLFVTF